MPMSCLRRMATKLIMLKELAFVFSSVSNGKFWLNCLGMHPLLSRWFYDYVFLMASHDYLIAILVFGNSFARILGWFPIEILEVLLVSWLQEIWTKTKNLLWCRYVMQFPDNTVGKEFENHKWKNRIFKLIL